MKILHAIAAFLVALTTPNMAWSAGLDGAGMSAIWALPFIGLLVSIAVLPLFAGDFWHHHQGKVSAFWAGLIIVPLAIFFGASTALNTVSHVVVLDFIPFIVMIATLFTLSGGICVRGNLNGTPLVNTGLLAAGCGLACIIGTTGASMVMVRPLIRANDGRIHNKHVFIFLIFLVSNIGGSLTPLGNPPLFLGFLKGVEFFWPATHLWRETLVTVGALLAIFFVLDSYFYRKEAKLPHEVDPTPPSKISIVGVLNMGLIVIAMAAVLLSSMWQEQTKLFMNVLNLQIPVGALVRDGVMILVAVLSFKLTPKQLHAENEFSWGPILEVAKLFIGIFICMAPVLIMLQAGKTGAFAPLVALTTNAAGQANNLAYFWLAGILSSFLDNAPTYLVFFNLAGGDPIQLMGPLGNTLAAIALGASFMGANTYIGNAPNFMVKAIAESGGVKMPSFFGYMAWSICILIPIFLVLGFVRF